VKFLSQSKFERELARELARQLPGVTVSRRAGHLDIKNGQMVAHVLTLNPYREYVAGGALAEVVSQYAGSVTTTIGGEVRSLDDPTLALPKLALSLRRRVAAGSVCVESPLSDLVLELVLDFPTCVVAVTSARLLRWGLTRERALEIARSQTTGHLPAWRSEVVGGQTIWVAHDGNGYGATAACYLDRLPADLIRARAAGRLWVAAPTSHDGIAFEAGASVFDPHTATIVTDPVVVRAALLIQSIWRQEPQPVCLWLYQLATGYVGRSEVVAGRRMR
jgi:hypothetical protein